MARFFEICKSSVSHHTLNFFTSFPYWPGLIEATAIILYCSAPICPGLAFGGPIRAGTCIPLSVCPFDSLVPFIGSVSFCLISPILCVCWFVSVFASALSGSSFLPLRLSVAFLHFSLALCLYLCLSVSLILSLSLSPSLSLCLFVSLAFCLSLILSVFLSFCLSWLSLSLPQDSLLLCLPRGVLDLLGLRKAASLPPLNTQVAPSSPCPRGSGIGYKEEDLEEKDPPPELQGLSSVVSLCVVMCVEGGQEALCLGEGESEGFAKVCALLAPAAGAGK